MVHLRKAEPGHDFPLRLIPPEKQQCAVPALHGIRLHPHDLSIVEFNSVAFHSSIGAQDGNERKAD